MEGWDRTRAVERVEQVVETVETEQMPVPVREVWVFGDVALGLDPGDQRIFARARDSCSTVVPVWCFVGSVLEVV